MGHFVTQKPQRPAVAPRRGPTAAERDQPCLRRSIDFSGNGRAGFALQNRHAFAHKLLANSDHLPLANPDGLTDFPVAATTVWVAFVGH